MNIEWQLIETAPRDGTTIFGCDAKMGNRGMVHFSDGEWEMVNGLTNFPNGEFFSPTHWHPLLPQPQRPVSVTLAHSPPLSRKGSKPEGRRRAAAPSQTRARSPKAMRHESTMDRASDRPREGHAVMGECKHFPTDDVLSTVTGYLVSPKGISGVYEVLNWMTGESVFTHQLPRIGKEAAPVLLAAHPELAQAYEEAEQVSRETWQHWRETWIGRYGETIAVPKLSADQHERIDPLSELAERVHPSKIIVVKS